MLHRMEAAPSPAQSERGDAELYFSRELSWLAFNDRVLEEALDSRNPVLERLKFISIFGTNLDEFFMIRVAAIKQQVAAGVTTRSDDGRLPAEHLAAISGRLRESVERQMTLLRDELLPALAANGIAIYSVAELGEERARDVEHLFDERIFPVLTPLAVDSGHPFPYISNLSLSLAVELEEMTPEGIVVHFARVKSPPTLPRFSPVAPHSDDEQSFVLLEDAIAHHLGSLFPGMGVRDAYLFRVTRDADLDLQEDEANDLLEAIESELQK
ncbi:MAG TPA: RNA degradosome polyphosphate kinase, partial [Candidatus Dormibacteraeota bacterium]|nr:RNA degradosome polyphosphate kinase [Candidatus Dormibacteraeota bacterium]